MNSLSSNMEAARCVKIKKIINIFVTFMNSWISGNVISFKTCLYSRKQRTELRFQSQSHCIVDEMAMMG